MTSGLKTVIYPVTDLAQAKRIYTALLGVEPYADAPYYVGFRTADIELGLDPHGRNQGLTAPIGYWEVDDIDASLKQLTDAGAEVVREPADVGGGKMIAAVKDTDGNVTGVMHTP
jgi:predicted enzyme related to lactoylglutathione lyase